MRWVTPGISLGNSHWIYQLELAPPPPERPPPEELDEELDEKLDEELDFARLRSLS